MSKDLEARIAKLEKANEPAKTFVPQPHKPFDPTAGMSMSPSTMRDFAAAVPDNLVRDIVGDSRRDANSPARALTPAALPVERGDGWAKPLPLRLPEGVALADRIVSAQDKIDKAALIKQRGG
jgi:hypothetical protein